MFPPKDKARRIAARGSWMTYVLIFTVITSFGGVTTQRQIGFDSYLACAHYAVEWGDSQRQLHPNSRVTWRCQKE